MNFDIELKKHSDEVQAIIENYLPKEEGFQSTVLKAMNYSMLAGGKRIRPILMQETYRLFGGSGEVIEPFMAAIEMIHTHSLIHDDLPALDNDTFRRGRETTHVVFGEAMAILAGDSLLNYAYETAIKAFAIAPDNTHIGEALAILSGKTGVYGMLGGQCVDVEAVGKQLEKERLDFIYRLKTGALIEASMMIGAVLAGADVEKISRMEEVATDVGLAFQIQDDILDVTSTTETLGKPVFSDQKNEKCTYVTFEGLEKAKKDVEQISRHACEVMEHLEEKNEFLNALIIRLAGRKN